MKTGMKMSLAWVALVVLLLVYPFRVTVAPKWKGLMKMASQCLGLTSLNSHRMRHLISSTTKRCAQTRMAKRNLCGAPFVRAFSLGLQAGFRDSAYMAGSVHVWRSV